MDKRGKKMIYELTEEKRKRLYCLLGEKWHEEVAPFTCSCGYHKPEDEEWITLEEHIEAQLSRTFTTYQDAHELFKKLVETGKWDKFEDFSAYKWFLERKTTGKPFIVWLFLSNHQRSCWLVAEFIQKEK